MYILEVYVTNAALYVNQLYSYYSDFYVDKYTRVNVRFNRSITNALVINIKEINNLEEYEKEIGFKISKILSVFDVNPIISEEQYELATWLSKTTVSPFISCLNTMLPKTLKTSKAIKNPKLLSKISINDISNLKLTKKQEEVFKALNNGMLASEARKISTSIIKKLIDINAISIYEEESSYEDNEMINDRAFKTLTSDQLNAYSQFLNTDKMVSLLFGVTGSGKTEIYLHLAKKYVQEGKQVLILVPEISLTPQMINRVKERFNDVIFYHSELNDQEKYEQYKRVKEGNTNIVVGTRSAIFLPFQNLGLIIIDEEHDTSYKQDNTPCYSAKNVAVKRCITHNAKLLLASATPGLDSYSRALSGEYVLLKLENRINNCLPEIEVIDLTSEIKSKSSYIISRKLKEEIQNTLNNHKQAIVLLNRRGYSPIIKCGDCGITLMCKNCDIPLNYHNDLKVLKCHQCGTTYNVPKYCPKCNSDKLLYYGFGTMRVEEELSRLFPQAKIERMDRDNVGRKGSHQRILDKFDKHEIDILIGTQMISKGLDYPDVTLVGILNADAGLMHQDYNATKLTFDLLMQASGRSGRAKDQGKVIIQAFNPDHYVLKAVINQDYKYYYNIEMNYRNKSSYPPYAHLLEIIVSDTNENRLKRSLEYLESKTNILSYKKFKAMEITKLNSQKRYRILLFNKQMSVLLNDTWMIVNDYLKLKNTSSIKIDIDPLYLD